MYKGYKNHEIIVCGNLCNTDMAVAELLSRYKIRVHILRYTVERLKDDSSLSGTLKYFSLDQVIYVETQKEALKYLKKAGLIISLTGAVDRFLRLRHFLLRNYCILPKTINITTGADITELVRLDNIAGKKFQNLLKRSLFNFLNPYPEVIESLKQTNIRNFQIIKSPYYLLPSFNIEDKIKEKSKDQKINYLLASSLDWGATDNKPGRNTTKGNNRFLNAFVRAVKNGENVHCTILNRGSDREIARNIVDNSGCAKSFEFLPAVDQGELSQLIAKMDVIVDQFDVGALGGIACEAMAQAKPVMIHIDKNCWPLVYDEEPPVINCHTEEEIYNAILEWSDRKKLQELGERAEKWVRKYHDVQTADFSEFILRVCLAAGLEWPRKFVTINL